MQAVPIRLDPDAVPRLKGPGNSILLMSWRQRMPGKMKQGGKIPSKTVGGIAGVVIGLMLAVPAFSAEAESPQPRHFNLNAQMIDSLRTTSEGKACEPHDVLTDLLKQVGQSTNVYPTENYFYFQFYRADKSYSGSLRFSVDKRDQGIVEFACYETYVSWLEPDHEQDFYAELSSKDGVQVTRVAHLQYDVAVSGQMTRFSLNNLDQVANAAILADQERFVGRSFDESGLAFDIVYNEKRKSFFFVLDTRRPVAENFVRFSPNVYLGRRTGMAFYEDSEPKRLVLIAANSEEIFRNGWFDGPFDHLPENFYETNGFWTAVYEAFPELKGKLSPSGLFLDNGMIFAVMPYRGYLTEAGLGFVKACAERAPDRSERIGCMTSSGDNPGPEVVSSGSEK